MIRKTCILLYLGFFFPFFVFTQTDPLRVKYNFMVDDGDKMGSKVDIERDGSPWKQRDGTDAKNTIDLEFQHEYVMTFSKPGFITKKIAVSTVVPKKKLDEPFDQLMFNVTIFRQYEGVNLVIFNNPVARYAYTSKKGVFEYDTDYSKRIIAEVKKAEDELKVKHNADKAGESVPKKIIENSVKPVVKTERINLVEKKQNVSAKSQPTIISDMDSKSSLFGGVMDDNHIEREYVAGNKHITETIVTRGGRKYIYKKVVYVWGVYYFRDNVSITEPTYVQEVL